MKPSNEQILRDAMEKIRVAHLKNVTIGRLEYSLTDIIDAALAATAPESAPADAPFAWATNDGRVATDKTKSSCMAKQSAVNFNIPLYTHPAPSQSADQVRDAAISRLQRYEEYGNESGGGLQEASDGDFVRLDEVLATSSAVEKDS